MKQPTTFLICFWALLGWAGAQEKLSYPDLVRRLYDLEHLATLPNPGETTAQFSSYDRASRYNEQTRKYEHWDANADGDGFIRKDGEQFVFAEMTGPGCIWRIWSATAKAGHVRIYLDGASAPAVDLPFDGYFNGQNAPFTRTQLVHTVANGRNNYTPIPFQKSCKIVADANWGQYFHFGYTTFPKGTVVPTFQRELSAEDNAALDAADQALRAAGPRTPPADAKKSVVSETVAGNGGVVAQRLAGPGAIALLRMKVELPAAPADRDALRELVLQIKWDGEQAASVWTPLGDFFGTAPGANKNQGLPCGLAADGWWYANWFMPFGKSAEVTVRNDGAMARALQMEIYQAPLHQNSAQLGRFHAKWHRDEFLPTVPERAIDWPVLKTTGRGRFVGLMLHIWNPRGGWWGEGDEKFFVDGEKFPSTFGTGSEDYFGYAWSSGDLFEHPLHSQTFNSGNSKGHISVNRWHLADQVPFQKNFEADLEKYYPNARPTFYAATAFWYLAPHGDDPYSAVPVTERTGYYIAPGVRKMPGAIEGESLKVVARSAGQTSVQDMSGYGEPWSNEAQLWWTGAQPGAKLDLALPVETAGRRQLSVFLTKARDYGIVQFSLDGEKLGVPIDLYHDGVVLSGEIKLGTRDLTAGDHTLSVEILGANDQAERSYMFGMDFLRLGATK